MSRPDAERAMSIYKNFTKQTDFVVAYLSTARQYEHQTRVEVPKLKHAPVNLGKQLDDYLMDPDFEINRRQYLAEQESKSGKPKFGKAATKNEPESRSATGPGFPDVQPSASKPSQLAQPAKGPDPDLIDFFDSIQQNQQPMATQASINQQTSPQFNNGPPFQAQQSPYVQPNGFSGPTNPYQSPNQFQQQGPFNTGFQTTPQQLQQQQQPQVQPNFTGAGFGGYTPQQSFQPGGLSSIPQESPASFQQQNPQQLGIMQAGGQQTTNPFRQSMMPNPTGPSQPAYTASPPATVPMQRQPTNPFAKSTPPPVVQQSFSPPVPDFQQQQFPQSAPLPSAEFQRPMQTGTNPFARNMAMNATQRPQTSGGLVPQPTGNTNPFRQSQFVNTATGSGWQNNQQAIGGGLDSIPTVPVFPRPAQQQPWQQ